MKARVLTAPARGPHSLPQCCARLTFHHARKPEEERNALAWTGQRVSDPMPEGEDRCAKSATIQIGDRFYCATHAGQVALNILLDATEAQNASERED